MNPENPNDPKSKQKFINLTLAALAGQVGFLTLAIILAALLGGMWLDHQFQTKPWFTIGLLLVSVPISIVTMFFVARKTIAKIKTGVGKKEQP